MKRALAMALALCAASVHAAYVGATRIEEGAVGKGQVAVVTFSSITNARQGIYDGLSGIGVEGASDIANAIVTWLTLLPSLDCADLTRRATVILVSPPEGQELPDQVAIIPLSPVNGENRLRQSLSEAYGKISGRSVLYCSEPRDEVNLVALSVIIMRDTAYVASSRESLQWIARHWRAGTIPNIPDVRDGATLSAFFDAELMGDVLDKLLAGAEATEDTASVVKLLHSLRDLLTPLDSLHVSLTPSIHSWDLAARLSPTAGKTDAHPSNIEVAGAPLAALPRDAYCASDGALAPFAPFVPSYVYTRYGSSAYSFFVGRRLFPGLGDKAPEDALAPFLTGESAAGFNIAPGEPPTRIQTFTLSNPIGAAAALRNLLPWGTDTKHATFRLPRSVGRHTIYGYNAKRQASAETAEDFAASALILLAQLNCIEFAIDGNNLVVVSGPYGAIEKLLFLPQSSRIRRSVGELAKSLPPLSDGETLMGAGELRPTQTFVSILQSMPGMESICRQLPRYGSGLGWRVSRKDGEFLFETSVSTTELLAFSIMGRIDQRQIGNILLDHIIGNQRQAQ